ncbi:MAG: hypothetical protein HQL42_12980 [Alphaproteobacteria bacterium]|nr:hypothetical protein [Alphaproteobacteria bacterium]
MTPTALLISLAGLSHRDASEFLNIRLDTVQSYFRHRRPADARDGVKAELKKLIARQERAAAEALDLIEQQTAGRPGALDVEIGYPADDHEAQALGFPCVGAWQAMAARVVARSPVPIRLVPRGSTVATAAAADVYEQRGRHDL